MILEKELYFNEFKYKKPFIVFGDRKINPRGGRVINITGEYLDRLYNYLNDNISKKR